MAGIVPISTGHGKRVIGVGICLPGNHPACVRDGTADHCQRYVRGYGRQRFINKCLLC